MLCKRGEEVILSCQSSKRKPKRSGYRGANELRLAKDKYPTRDQERNKNRDISILIDDITIILFRLIL